MKTLFVSLVLLVVSSAAASPLDPHHLPLGATGVGHVDMDLLRKTVVFAPLVSKLGEGDANTKEVAAPLVASASSISLWLGPKPERGRRIAILVEFPRGSPDQQRFVTSVVKTTRAKSVHGRYETPGSFGDPFTLSSVDQFVVLGDVASVDGVVATLNGKAPSLSPSAIPNDTQGVACFVTLGAPLLEELRHHAASMMMKSAMTSLVVTATQVGSDTRAHGSAVLANADQARHVKALHAASPLVRVVLPAWSLAVRRRTALRRGVVPHILTRVRAGQSSDAPDPTTAPMAPRWPRSP